MKSLLFVMLLITYISNAYSAEGYKDLKFGMSKKQVLKSKICSFKEVPLNPDEPWEILMYCADIKVHGQGGNAIATLVDNKLVRFAIEFIANPSDVIKELMTKYNDGKVIGDNITDFTTPGSFTALTFDKAAIMVTILVDTGSKANGIIYYIDAGYQESNRKLNILKDNLKKY